MQTLHRILLGSLAVTGFLTFPFAASASCVIPNQIANGQPIDATPVNGNFASLSACEAASSPAGSQNSLQVRGADGAFVGVDPLDDGELMIGAAGNAPTGSTLTAGQGVQIQNSAGAITVSAPGGSETGGVDWLNAAATVRPTFNDFALKTSSTAPTGASLAATVRGFVLTATGGGANTAMMAEANTPGSAGWVATMLTAYSGPLSTYSVPAIAVRDSVNNRAVQFGIGGASTTTYRFSYTKTVGGSGLNSFIGTADTLVDAGLAAPSEPIWTRLTYDGTNLTWAFSRDGQFFVNAYVVAANETLTNLDKVGPAVLFVEPTHTTWPVAYHILSWTITSL
ncbi:hypothetical protein NBH19_08105 [Rhizobium sp. S95]|uniref:Uncharacterized protein n=1 Tax=Ciceribacter sichuanensis TaxID=2949647 RepID=A0AAJ1C1T1_9HYPH|nr:MULTISPECIES: hypothetical protein [unclassified Ciceribacter]MCM2396044.1 hypothetical protein [Ciceribacter sp. S95]MCO5960192.1 hypothetical protein [Ciceribacter sp. S101]